MNIFTYGTVYKTGRRLTSATVLGETLRHGLPISDYGLPVTPRTILGRAFFAGYSAITEYDANTAVRKIPYDQIGAANLVQSAGIEDLTSAGRALVTYITDIRAYYDNRVSNTSGGKRTRLQHERSDLLGEAGRALDLISRRIDKLRSDSVNAAEQQTTPKLPPDSGSGSSGGAGSGSGGGQSGGSAAASDFSKYLIPLGAGLAALFFLKGH